MYPITGLISRTRSPSTWATNRSTPCVEGCWGRMSGELDAEHLEGFSFMPVGASIHTGGALHAGIVLGHLGGERDALPFHEVTDRAEDLESLVDLLGQGIALLAAVGTVG